MLIPEILLLVSGCLNIILGTALCRASFSQTNFDDLPIAEILPIPRPLPPLPPH